VPNRLAYRFPDFYLASLSKQDPPEFQQKGSIWRKRADLQVTAQTMDTDYHTKKQRLAAVSVHRFIFSRIIP
jgi:hypothetical protein